MKHQSPQELAKIAATLPLSQRPRMSRRQRLEHWAAALENHGGALNALRRLEFLSPDERRAYRGANTPLTIAFNDPVLRVEGLQSDRLGDAMDFFELNEAETHRLLCDCRYNGRMTGPRVAKSLRRHAERKELMTSFKQAIGRLFSRSA